MNEKIAFIGVGNMGSPMAENLFNAGKKIIVFDISNQMLEKAKAKGPPCIWLAALRHTTLPLALRRRHGADPVVDVSAVQAEVAAESVEVLPPVLLVERRRQGAAVLLLFLLLLAPPTTGGLLLLHGESVSEGPEALAQVAQQPQQLHTGPPLRHQRLHRFQIPGHGRQRSTREVPSHGLVDLVGAQAAVDAQVGEVEAPVPQGRVLEVDQEEPPLLPRRRRRRRLALQFLPRAAAPAAHEVADDEVVVARHVGPLIAIAARGKFAAAEGVAEASRRRE